MSKVYVEFDGASKGNPGRAGAGAILRSEDGTVIAKVRRGLGTTTNNAAEYEGLKLGLETARELGYDHVHAQGDSQLVQKQVQGDWQIKNENLARLCRDVGELKKQFKSFDMSQVPRDYNSGADRQANKAVNLPAGEVYKEHCGHGGHYGLLVEEEFASDAEDEDEEEKEEAVIHDDVDDNDLDANDSDDKDEEEKEEAVVHDDDDDNDLDVNDSDSGDDDDDADDYDDDDDDDDVDDYDDDD